MMSQPKTHISFADSPLHTIHLQITPPQEEAAPEDPSLGRPWARPPTPASGELFHTIRLEDGKFFFKSNYNRKNQGFRVRVNFLTLSY